MRRFNVYSFYELGAAVGPLRLVELLDKDMVREIFYVAKRHLDSLRTHKFSSLEVANKAIASIQVDMETPLKELDRRGGVGEDDAKRLSESVSAFERILEAELPTEHTYVTEQLRAFSMSVLVDSATRAFSDATLSRLGEDVKKDITEAGRCLAFELPTAAGVHMMRAFEKVFRKFYRSCAGKEPDHRDVWKLLDDLRKAPGVDEETLNILNVVDHVRLRRNPLIHEVFLEMDEAVEIFDITKSAITAMGKGIYA